MKCESCNSSNLKDELVNTDYRYSSYFNEYLKEDTVKFTCKNCGHEWYESF